MAETQSRTASETGDADLPATKSPRVYGEWDGYATARPVTARSIEAKPEETKAVPANPAQWMFDRLVRLIDDFEKNLSDEEEIGGRIVGAPGEGSFHIDDIGFWGPDMIMFYGKNAYGRPVRLIQHYTQLSVLLTSMPKEKERPRRIGFAIRERIDEDEKGEAKAGEAAAAGAEQEAEAHPS
jgi:hypothetical protein